MNNKEELRKIFEKAIGKKDVYTLADVLRVIYKRRLTVGLTYQIYNGEFGLFYSGKPVFWNLKKDLNAQPKEIINFLHNILK